MVVWDTPPPDFTALLFERINPARNEARFYYLALQPTLFHPLAVVRIYGRIGQTQRVLPPVPVAGLDEAWPLLRGIIRTRLRRGYRLVEVGAEATCPPYAQPYANLCNMLCNMLCCLHTLLHSILHNLHTQRKTAESPLCALCDKLCNPAWRADVAQQTPNNLLESMLRERSGVFEPGSAWFFLG